MSVLLLILGLILFVGLVVVHEFGHYIAARRSGVDVEEFGIGFPPQAWSRKLKNGTLLSLNWLPLGGFVRLKGEHDSDKQPGSYGAAPLKAKIRIMTAGVVMNLITAIAVLGALALVGMPKVIDNQFTLKNDTKVIKHDVLIGYIEPDSPAAKAGLKRSDKLISFYRDIEPDMINCLSLDCPRTGEVVIKNEEQLPSITKSFAGQTIHVKYQRGSKISTATATLRGESEVAKSKNTSNTKGYLGISPTEYILQRSTWSAPIVAVGLAGQITGATLGGLGHAIGNLVSGHAAEASSQVAGPVGIFVLLKDGSLLGYQFILFIVGIISLTLAIMNILPIPALDGGRLFVTLIYRGLKKPLTKRTEQLIHGMGFLLLMLLFVLITIVDVRRFW